MITELDDYAVHQIYSTMDHVESGDPRWFESLWFCAGTKSGEIMIEGHMGSYPNTNTMDAAASIRVGDVQYNVRTSRELQRDRDNRDVGPISAEIVEHFKRWRFVLSTENDQDISYELEFESMRQPMGVGNPVFHRQGNHVIWNMWHYAQTGRVSGTATVHGETYDLDKDSCWGVRDRSWGIRPIFGQIPNKAPLPESITAFSIWLGAAFEEHDLWCWYMEGNNPKRKHLLGTLSSENGGSRLDGAMAYDHEDDREQPRVVGIEYQLNVDPKSRMVKDGNVVFRDWDGNQHDLSVKGLSAMYLKGLGYAHPDFRQGEFKGDSLKQVDRVDLGDSNIVAAQIENHSGPFIPFGVDSFCELDLRGQTGYGVIRVGI